MSVWVLHLPLTAKEDECIDTRQTLTLPLDGFPDFTGVATQGAYRLLLQKTHPDLPPESMKGLLERSWGVYQSVQEEDLIIVPLRSRYEYAIAQVSGAYSYEDGAHHIAVVWMEKRLPMSALRRHGDLWEGTGLVEVTNPQARNVIRSRLPHSYNRFAKWKWIIGAVIAMKLTGLALYQLHR